jgi:hypothetical protein
LARSGIGIRRAGARRRVQIDHSLRPASPGVRRAPSTVDTVRA